MGICHANWLSGERDFDLIRQLFQRAAKCFDVCVVLQEFKFKLLTKASMAAPNWQINLMVGHLETTLVGRM